MVYDGYISYNGTSITAPTAAKERYTDYMPVEPGALYVIDYKVKLETASNFWGQYCKYDSEKAVVGLRTTLPTPTLDDDGYYHSYFEISIPSTTAYLRVTARTYGDAILTVYKYVNKSSEIQPSLQVMRKERAEEIAEAIESISPSTIAIEAYPVVYSPNMYDYVCKGCNHRGYDTYQNYPENTMPAYQASKAHDFYFVETDVQVTSDEEYVLLHDPSINRTARNADGTAIEGTVNINSITLAQAKEYDFGIYQGSTWEGVQIPTLDEFLTYCKKACLHPYLEVKFDYSQTRVRAFVDKVLSHGLRNRVTYISGDTQALAEIASYDKTARIGIIYNEPSTSVIDTVLSLRTVCNEVFLDIKTASTDLISACVANHVPIELWTYDAPDSGLLAKPEYVTGITHNKTHAGKLIHDSIVTE
jgi:glycerophosphoryl diester phosphodiesterase